MLGHKKGVMRAKPGWGWGTDAPERTRQTYGEKSSCSVKGRLTRWLTARSHEFPLTETNPTV